MTRSNWGLLWLTIFTFMVLGLFLALFARPLFVWIWFALVNVIKSFSF